MKASSQLQLYSRDTPWIGDRMGHLVCVDPGAGVKGVSAENGIIPLIRIKQLIYTL